MCQSLRLIYKFANSGEYYIYDFLTLLKVCKISTSFKHFFKVISGVESIFFWVGFFGGRGGETFIAQPLDPQVCSNTVYALRINFFLSFALSVPVFKFSLEFDSFLCHPPIVLFLYWFILKKEKLVMVLELLNLQSFKLI